MAASPTGRLGLPRSSRLKQRREFAQARARGRRVVCGCLIVNVLRKGADEVTRLGVVTSRKVGEAVARSRARRLLRESFRLHQFEIEGPVDLVLVARPSIAGKKLAEVERDFLGVMAQAGLLKQAG